MAKHPLWTYFIPGTLFGRERKRRRKKWGRKGGKKKEREGVRGRKREKEGGRNKMGKIKRIENLGAFFHNFGIGENILTMTQNPDIIK